MCLLMTDNYSACKLSILVENKPTLTSSLTFCAFKDGITVPFSKLLNPNNGLFSWSMFYEAVRQAVNFATPLEQVLTNVVGVPEGCSQNCSEAKKEKKIVFVTSELQHFAQKQYCMYNFCFVIETYPKCSFDQMREHLVLPSKRKLQCILVSVEHNSSQDI